MKDYPIYGWVAKSNDNSYEDCGRGFITREACYNAMRNAVLEKMKWNTEWEDVNADSSYISYEVLFAPDFIEHISYSGKYLYKIIGCDANGEFDKDGLAELDKELGLK